MTGENLVHAGKNAVAGCACRTDGQKLQQAVFIDGGRDIRVAEERFGSEPKTSVPPGVL